MVNEEFRPLAGYHPKLESAVAGHPFLAGIDPSHLRLLAACAVRCQFRPGQVIFRKGDSANRFYLIESGKVALESSAGDQVIRIEVIGGGDLLGWSWIFPPFVWHFDARAVEPTTAIFLYGILREHCEADPALGYVLFKRMSEVMMRRLQAARVKLSEAIKNGVAPARR